MLPIKTRAVLAEKAYVPGPGSDSEPVPTRTLFIAQGDDFVEVARNPRDGDLPPDVEVVRNALVLPGAVDLQNNGVKSLGVETNPRAAMQVMKAWLPETFTTAVAPTHISD